MSRPGELEVGQLYLGFYRNGLLVWKQPHGIGTLVYPQLPQVFPWFGKGETDGGQYEWPMSYPAQYYWGCGHPANTAEVYQYYNPYDEEIKALLCCPQCSYINQIMPLREYQDYLRTPIVVG